MIGEVGFPNGKKSRDSGLEFVVYPEAAHCVVDGRIDHHRRFVGVVIGNLFVHLEKIAVLLFHYVFAQTADGIVEVEENGEPRIVYPKAGVTAFFGCTACYVARYEVTKGGVATL